jgi:hydrogenase/urease accessory protein HupE
MRQARDSAFGVALLAFLLTVLISRAARAHEVGVSRGQYEQQGGKVFVGLTFAQHELVASLPWLSNRGVAGPLAFEEHKDRLGAWMVARLSITAGRETCAGSFDGMRLDGDGVAIAASYACPVDAKDVEVEARFMSELERGHRHIATFESKGRTIEIVATASHPSFALRAPEEDAPGGDAIGLLNFVRMGIEHILTGFDHLLFLLGLVLLGRPIRSLVAAITAFTVAHSLTLALAAFEVWTPSPRIVEPCIALSIAYVGIENWFVPDATGRWRITFAFGLVHGFGFAGALRAIAVPHPRIPMALFGFNLGVEAGQVAVLALLLPLVLAARRLDLWQRAGMRACTGAVAAVGIVWFLVRLGGGT